MEGVGCDFRPPFSFLFFSVCLLDLDFSFVIFSGGSILLLFFLVKKKNYKFLGMFKLKSKGGEFCYVIVYIY